MHNSFQICPPAGPSAMTAAMKYGIKNEDIAATAYLDLYGPLHNGMLHLERVGLVVPVGDGHIGASIDRLATCNCGLPGCKQKWIVEIKCLPTIEFLPPGSDEAIKKLNPDLLKDEGMVVLNENSKYFTQVQVQMAILRIPDSELWIWSPLVREGPLVIEVPFNESFWLQLKAKLDVFYMEFILPILLQNAKV